MDAEFHVRSRALILKLMAQTERLADETEKLGRQPLRYPAALAAALIAGSMGGSLALIGLVKFLV